MTRNVLAIIAGYGIFVISSLALFKISGRNPHADPTAAFMVIAAIYGAVFSFIAGLVTQLIAEDKDLRLNYALALIIAAFAAFSYFKSTGNHWTQILAIFIFTPASVLGGLFYTRRKSK